MRGPHQDRWLALADDLTGASEVAAALMLHGTRSLLRLVYPSAPATVADGGVPSRGCPVLDLDCRHRSPDEVMSLVRRAVIGHRPRHVIAKIDSLLRGSPEAMASALRADGAPVVVATALPTADRVVLGGVVHLSGVPLHQSNAWRMEAGDPPESVSAALAPVPTQVIDLATVRSPRLPAVLSSIVQAGAVPVCDAETDTDLDCIALAGFTQPSVRFVGSGGLAAAVARSLTPGTAKTIPAASRESHAVLIVVGTAEPAAAEQARRLVHTGVSQVRLGARGLDDHDVRSASANRLRAALRSGSVVVTLDAPADGSTATRSVARHLAQVVAEALSPCPVATPAIPAAESPVDLVLTGGETARRVLDAMGIDLLIPVGQIHPGAVHSVTADGRAVVTRAGSFGNPDSLLDIVRFLHAPHMPLHRHAGEGTQREVLP